MVITRPPPKIFELRFWLRFWGHFVLLGIKVPKCVPDWFYMDATSHARGGWAGAGAIVIWRLLPPTVKKLLSSELSE